VREDAWRFGQNTDKQFWRILVHPILFANSTELLLGELLLYSAGRTIERCVYVKSCGWSLMCSSFGPRKFSVS
jgi:hypothetical protein